MKWYDRSKKTFHTLVLRPHLQQKHPQAIHLNLGKRLVEEQACLSKFWVEWRTAEHKFLSETLCGLVSEANHDKKDSRRIERPEDKILQDGYKDEEDLQALLLDYLQSMDTDDVRISSRDQGRSVVDANQRPAGPQGTKEEKNRGGSDKSTERDDEGGHKSLVLESRIKELEAKLVETEMLLGSEPGKIILQLENELAQTRLELAHIEAEKDDLEVRLLNLQQCARSS